MMVMRMMMVVVMMVTFSKFWYFVEPILVKIDVNEKQIIMTMTTTMTMMTISMIELSMCR